MRLNLLIIRRQNFTNFSLLLFFVVLVAVLLPDVPHREPGGQGVILKIRVADPVFERMLKPVPDPVFKKWSDPDPV